MRISKVKIENFRSFKDAEISLDAYTCLVGPNGSGKSNVLSALNLFFRETANAATDLQTLQEEDFHNKDTSHPVRITVTFVDLSGTAQDDFADYYRQGELIVSAVAEFDPNTRQAPVLQYGQRRGMVQFAAFFQAVDANKPAPELKGLYETLRSTYADLPPSAAKQKMIDALHDYEASHSDLAVLIPSSDQFYGFTRGANRLAKHVQWVYVPAVKDVATEQTEAKNTALGRLLERTVRSRVSFAEPINELRTKLREGYGAMLAQQQSALDGLSASLGARLQEWAHPDATMRLEWRNDPERAIRIESPVAQVLTSEGQFEGNLARFGHGLQRSLFLSLLQELSAEDETSAPTLTLACEEPELYQHPPQARHLARVLRRLGSQGAQVLLSTHSPYFVSGLAFEGVRLVRKSSGASAVASASVAAVAKEVDLARDQARPTPATGMLAKIHQELQVQLSEMFFASVLVLTEGIEDIAYFTTYLGLLGLDEEFRRLGGAVVPCNGKSGIVQARAVANLLGIPTYTVFDADAHRPDKNGSRQKHELDNRALLALCGAHGQESFPAADYWGKNVTMWRSEIGQVVAEELGEPFVKVRQEVEAAYGHVPNLGKNVLAVADELVAAWDRGLRSKSLEHLCREVIRLGQEQAPARVVSMAAR